MWSWFESLADRFSVLAWIIERGLQPIRTGKQQIFFLKSCAGFIPQFNLDRDSCRFRDISGSPDGFVWPQPQSAGHWNFRSKGSNFRWND